MYYCLAIDETYPESYWFKYDHQASPDYLLFQQGNAVSNLKSAPIFSLQSKISLDRLLRFDYFMSDGLPFISKRFSDLVKKIAPDDIQLIDAEVWVNKHKIEGCTVPVITNLTPCVDMKRSKFEPIFDDIPDSPIEVSFIEFIKGSLGTHLITRPKEAPTKIVVSEIFKQHLKDAEIKGVAFLPNSVRLYE